MVFQGTDTVGITVASTLLILAKYPDIQVHFVFFVFTSFAILFWCAIRGELEAVVTLTQVSKYKGSSLGC